MLCLFRFRTTANYFLAALAIRDIIVTIAVVPFVVDTNVSA